MKQEVKKSMNAFPRLSRQFIQQLCKKYDVHPDKERGQHFLIDQSVLDRMIEAAELTRDDTVLEIGPGLGVLTSALAQHAGQVIAVELDPKLVDFLRTEFFNEKHIQIIEGDILHLYGGLTTIHLVSGYKLVANLPYHITSIVLRRFLGEATARPSMLVVMVQKEVAERMTAPPGEMSMLSVMVQYFGTAEIIRVVPRGAFWPVPEIESAIVRITPRAHPLLSPEREADFFRLARIGFSARRKQLQHNMSAGLRRPRSEVKQILEQCLLLPTVRAQELSIEQWIVLAERIMEHGTHNT